MNEGKLAYKMNKENLEAQAASAEMDYIGRLPSAESLATEYQVSGAILQNPQRFLKWERDENGYPVTKSEEDKLYEEPYLDEPLAFLSNEERKFLNQLDNTLTLVYQFREKYGVDMHNTFNQMVQRRKSLIMASRATGNAVRAAKSQIVISNANITREKQQQEKKTKLFGVL